MWGLPPDAAVDYEVWRAHVHPDDLDRVLAAVERCVDPRHDGVYDIEYRVIGADGVERWIATRGQTSFRAGKAIAFSGVALDITERKRANQRLRESEAWLRAILAQLPVGVGLFDRDGRFVIRGGLLGDLWDEDMPSRGPAQTEKWRGFGIDGRPLAVGDYPGERALRGETVVPGTDFIHTTQGREVWIRVAAAPFRNAQGEIEGAVATLENVDHQKRAEQAIRESEERFRQFAEHSSDIIWILDLQDRRLEYLSPAYEKIWGEARDLSFGYWAESIHSDDREQVKAALDRVAEGEVLMQEYRVIRPDGAMRAIRETQFPMRDRHGQVQRIGGITQDVTIRTASVVYLIDSNGSTRTQVRLTLMRAGYSVKSFTSGEDFLVVAPVLALGCVVIDSRSLGAKAVMAVRQMKANGSSLPVVMIGSSQGDAAFAIQAMKAGAADWIESPYKPDALLTGIASVLADIRAALERDREIELVRTRIAAMSTRERQVLEGLLAAGTNKTIGRELGISPRTVELHRANVMEKLGVQNLTRAMLLLAAAGFQPDGSERKQMTPP
jgi:PAS domain S-box-containing protein